MRTTIRLIRAVFSLVGIALIALGAAFWSGRLLGLVQLHMLLGAVFVLCMWALAALALPTRSARGLAAAVLVWSLIVPLVGVEQLRFPTGHLHWVIQATHLLVGLIAMGLGHALARRITPAGAAASELAST